MNDSTSRETESQPENEPKHPDDPGAGDGSTDADDASTPFSPDSDDDSALGDTDEHSDA